MATIREETLIRYAAEHGADAALALAAQSPPCADVSRAGTFPVTPGAVAAIERGLARYATDTGRETHTVTYDGQTIRVVHHNGTVSTVLRTSDVGRELTDALFEVLRLRAEAPAAAQGPAEAWSWDDPLGVYRAPDGREVLLVFSNGSGTMAPIRDASGALRVGYLNPDGTVPDMREAEYGWVPRGSLVPLRVLPNAEPTREPVPYDDDPEGDNWHPADVEEGAKGTCRRCGRAIYWSWDAPTGMDDDGEPPQYGWWYAAATDTEVCTPGPDDADRWHAPTTTPTPSDRGNPPLHAPCFEARHGFEPDMDPDVVTWQPGTCAACGAAGVIVFRLSDDAAAALGGD